MAGAVSGSFLAREAELQIQERWGQEIKECNQPPPTQEEMKHILNGIRTSDCKGEQARNP